MKIAIHSMIDLSGHGRYERVMFIKLSKYVLVLALVLNFGLLGSVRADDAAKPAIKPYTLGFCAVCEMKFSDSEKPHTFVYKDREIKVCDKSEEADFKKDPAKYLKIIEAAEAKKARDKTP